MTEREASPGARRGPSIDGPPPGDRAGEPCEICGAREVLWLRCKLICRNCQTILKTCADL
jgi:hypothetical protein